MELQVYELKIDEKQEAVVDAIALVNSPAIESNFIAFSRQQENMTFSMQDEKMELLGAAMIPDMQIYRRDETTNEEYYVFFSKDTIRNIAQVFSKKGFQSNTNIEHSTIPAKSYVFQSYIVDDNIGLHSPKGLDLPDGSWVVGVKVEDRGVWDEIKSGSVKGFSIEGIFKMYEQKLAFKNSGTLINKKREEEVFKIMKNILDMLNKL